MDARIPTLVLGGTGYVAGEVIRLVLGHPNLQLAGVMSDSQPGEPVGKSFPHLAAVLGETRFLSQAEIEQQISTLPRSAVFSAAPHGVSAALIDTLLKRAEAKGTKPRVVDISADYRYSTAEAYAAVRPAGEIAPEAESAIDQARVETAEKARRTIEAFVRRQLPRGSASAYTRAELADMNRRRRSVQPFAPYDERPKP